MLPITIIFCYNTFRLPYKVITFYSYKPIKKKCVLKDKAAALQAVIIVFL